MTTTETTTMEFRWTTSRGRDTYGYTICTLYVDGVKVARCNGGGYDMKGTCLGDYIATRYADRLRNLKPEDMPAQSHWEPANKPRRFCTACDGKIPHGRVEYLATEGANCPKCGEWTRADHNDGKTIDDGRYFGVLVFVDPTYDARTAKLEKADGTFTKQEDEGKTLGELQDAGKLVDLDIIRAAYKRTSKHATERHTVPSIDGACGMSSVEAIARAIGVTFEWIKGRRNSKTDAYIIHDAR